jgi:DNA-binding beta-propeller fold protein YncE
MNRFYNLLFVLICGLPVVAINAQVEICFNRIDDDGDGAVDCIDSDCETYAFCFECDERYYQVINNRFLATLDIENQFYTDIFRLNGINAINGAAMNPSDGHVYASAISNGNHILVLVGNNGSLGSLGLELPGNSVYFMATIDDAGNMYLANLEGNILKIDLNQATLAWEDTGIPYPGGTDFAFHYGDKQLYAVGNDNRLIRVNIETKEVVYSDLIGPINNDIGYYGAVWSNRDGSLFLEKYIL